MLAEATVCSLSPFAAPWVPSSPVSAGPSSSGRGRCSPSLTPRLLPLSHLSPRLLPPLTRGRPSLLRAAGDAITSYVTSKRGLWRTLVTSHLRRSHHSPPPWESRRTLHHHLHIPREGERVDAEGFTLVESCHCWRRRAHPRVSSCHPVPPTLVGLYFNCLAGDHVTVACCFLPRYLHYRCTGHRARDCKRGRSPTRTTGRGRSGL